MSIEKQIEDLTSAILKLEKSLGLVNTTPTQITPTPKIDVKAVKELAKKKMSEGVKRTTIKDLIIELKAESIADLDGDGLNSLYIKLAKLGGV
jgi:hypothetical protein